MELATHTRGLHLSHLMGSTGLTHCSSCSHDAVTTACRSQANTAPCQALLTPTTSSHSPEDAAI